MSENGLDTELRVVVTIPGARVAIDDDTAQSLQKEVSGDVGRRGDAPPGPDDIEVTVQEDIVTFRLGTDWLPLSELDVVQTAVIFGFEEFTNVYVGERDVTIESVAEE